MTVGAGLFLVLPYQWVLRLLLVVEWDPLLPPGISVAALAPVVAQGTMRRDRRVATLASPRCCEISATARGQVFVTRSAIDLDVLPLQRKAREFGVALTKVLWGIAPLDRAPCDQHSPGVLVVTGAARLREVWGLLSKVWT